MNIRPAVPRRGGHRQASAATLSWPLALAFVPVAAGAASWLLRPRGGQIESEAVSLDEVFSAEEVGRARRFSRPQLALAGAGALIQGGLVGVLALRPPGLLRASGPAGAYPRSGAAAAGGALTTTAALAALPLRAVGRRRALRAGLATQSWPGWGADVVKGTAISASMSGALAVGLTELMRRQPRGWWLTAAGAAGALGATMSFLGPVLLDPLFNRFRPLGPGDARHDVLELAHQAGVDVGEVYEVDASRRTTAANAYVTGLGATKRVVLFDTLLERFTRDETRLVVAHELAHVRYRDVTHGLVLGALVAPPVLHAAAAVTRALTDERELRAGSPAVLPALAVGTGVATALAGPPSAWLSRQIEARADAFSLTLTDAPAPFESFERRVVLQNLADPAPPRWLVSLMSSHPPTLQRIGYARAYARRRAGVTDRGAAEDRPSDPPDPPEAQADRDRTRAGS